MKKFLIVLALALILVFGSAAPALAKVHVSVRAKARATKVVFTTKVTRYGHTRRGKVRITIYRNGHKLRTITAKRVGSRYKASWNLRTTSGKLTSPGAVKYRVRVRTKWSGRGTKSGGVTVPTTPTEVMTPVTPIDPVVTDPTTVPVIVPVTYTPAGGTRWIGFFQQGTPVDMTPLANLETAIGKQSAVVNWYITDSNSFPISQVQRVADHGSTPMITLEFWSTQNGGVASIVNGSKDEYLQDFADDAKAYGGDVWIRPFHEMNGNWYPWSGTTNGNSPAQVVAAWRHVHDIFVARGATNVKFVWCVNNDSVPGTAANSADKYFPGDDYVDSLAIDGYNWGVSDPSWSTWRSFSSLIGSSYNKVTALSGKPLFIAEIGCPEEGGNKAAWISDMFSQITSTYTRIQGVCWFNVDSRETQNADWRVDSSEASVASFKAAVAAGY